MKCIPFDPDVLFPEVAPLAGAWIEIYLLGAVEMALAVAPLAGAWIEISSPSIKNLMKPSLPSRERGLKYKKDYDIGDVVQVAPLAGAWIEIAVTMEGL